MRIVVVGMSLGPTCGVCDHATVLADALAREHVSSTFHWLERREAPIGAARGEIRAWTGELAAALARERPDAVLLHYSVFSYSHRGFPVFATPTIAALRRSRIPLVTFLHEFMFAATFGGLRGKAWALSQRVPLIGLMRASAAAAVTTPSRVAWLESRRWLPKRPIAFAPVFSNLPAPTATSPSDDGDHVIGLFGYSYRETTISVVLDALRALIDGGAPVRLRLLGAPGRSSQVAEAWLAAARARGVESALSFSGILAAQELSNALAQAEVLLSVDPPGPTGRKTTFAASLASGSAVVALDGRDSWPQVMESRAAEVVAPTPHAVADALGALLADPGSRAALGARGRAFAERQMSASGSARIVAGLLGDAAAR